MIDVGVLLRVVKAAQHGDYVLSPTTRVEGPFLIFALKKKKAYGPQDATSRYADKAPGAS